MKKIRFAFHRVTCMATRTRTVGVIRICYADEVCDLDVGQCRKVVDCPDTSGVKCFISDYIIPNGSLDNGTVAVQNINADEGSYLGNSYKLNLPTSGVSFCNAGAVPALSDDKSRCVEAFKDDDNLKGFLPYCELIGKRTFLQSGLFSASPTFKGGMLQPDSFIDGAYELVKKEQESGNCFWMTVNKLLPFKLQQTSKHYQHNSIYFEVDFMNSILMSQDERFRLQLLPN